MQVSDQTPEQVQASIEKVAAEAITEVLEGNGLRYSLAQRGTGKISCASPPTKFHSSGRARTADSSRRTRCLFATEQSSQVQPLTPHLVPRHSAGGQSKYVEELDRNYLEYKQMMREFADASQVRKTTMMTRLMQASCSIVCTSAMIVCSSLV